MLRLNYIVLAISNDFETQSYETIIIIMITELKENNDDLQKSTVNHS